jgi:hypothetical protein
MLPVGVQTFEKLRLGGYIYVDKTPYMTPLVAGGYFFLSRPRRFGKSLLVSTLKAIFEGKKELFEGLWLEDQHDFKPRPVIHMDFSRLDLSVQPLETVLLNYFSELGHLYSVEVDQGSAKDAFRSLIAGLSKVERVVVLVDEYDKALTDFLDEPTKRQEHQSVLKGVYGVLKPMDTHLHLVLLTGVSKFGKLSLFSDLNNLLDISLIPQYAQMLGYTREEIQANFPSYLENAAKRLGLSLDELWYGLQFWYNGYSWDAEHKVYCPYSMLVFFSNPAFRGYWYETGTPTFLLKLIKEQGIEAYNLERLQASDALISVADVDHLNPISIMFQTGYLTIQKLKSTSLGIRYELGYPNEEVRQAFSRQLLQLYLEDRSNVVDSLGFGLQDALAVQDWDGFFERVNRAFAGVPYQVFKAQESYFHSLMHLMLVSTGYGVQSEVSTNRGRMDTVVELPERVCIFEFKLEGTPDAAIQQIKDQGYASKYSKPVTLVGVVFDRKAKQVGQWKVEQPA